MNVQIIERDGKPEYAVVPIAEFQRLQELAESAEDNRAYDKAMHEIETGEDEIVPAEIADQILAGESPVKVWRKYRGITQVTLSKRIGVSQAYVVAIEKGERNGSIAVMRKIASALSVDLDDLVDS